MTKSQDTETHGAALDKAFEGRRRLRLGDYKGAIAAYTEAIELDPTMRGPYRYRAESYKRLGREKEAGSDLRDLADLSGSDDLYYRSEERRAALDKAFEGRHLFRLGDYKGAIAAHTEAIRLDTGIVGAYQHRAKAYRRLGMASEAESDLKYRDDLESQREQNAAYRRTIDAYTEVMQADPRHCGSVRGSRRYVLAPGNGERGLC